MVTVNGNSNPTYPTNPTNPTNPTTINLGELTDKNPKMSQNCTDFSFVQDGNNVCVYGRVFRVGELKYAMKNFKPMPWQPNLGKNQPKLH